MGGEKMARPEPEFGGRGREKKIENDEFLFGLIRDFAGMCSEINFMNNRKIFAKLKINIEKLVTCHTIAAIIYIIA